MTEKHYRFIDAITHLMRKLSKRQYCPLCGNVMRYYSDQLRDKECQDMFREMLNDVRKLERQFYSKKRLPHG